MSTKPKSEKSKWMAQADKWFSEFIRLRDSDEFGRVTCVTCSHRGHWRDLQCGHWITRGHMATRYDERNCHTQCRGCNYNGGQHLKHHMFIANTYGHSAVDELMRKGTVFCRRSMVDYQWLAAKYKGLVDEVKKNEPLKYNRA